MKTTFETKMTLLKLFIPNSKNAQTQIWASLKVWIYIWWHNKQNTIQCVKHTRDNGEALWFQVLCHWSCDSSWWICDGWMQAMRCSRHPPVLSHSACRASLCLRWLTGWWTGLHAYISYSCWKCRPINRRWDSTGAVWLAERPWCWMLSRP